MSDTPGVGTRHGEFIIVLLTQPEVYDIVRELKSVAYYTISLIHKAGFRLSTRYMNSLLKMSVWNQMLYLGSIYNPFSMEEPKNNFLCPEEPMKTKTKQEVIGSGRRLLQDCQFPDKYRSNVWRYVWSFPGISEIVFYLFHDFSRNHELRSAER